MAVPGGDPAFLCLSKTLLVPAENYLRFKVPVNKRLQSLSMALLSLAGPALRPDIVFMSICQTMDVWSRDLSRDPDLIPNILVLYHLDLIPVTLQYCVEVLVDILSLISRIGLWSVLMQRTCWLRTRLLYTINVLALIFLSLDGAWLHSVSLDTPIRGETSVNLLMAWTKASQVHG